MVLRILFVVLLVGFAAVHAVRTAVVRDSAAAGVGIWPGHPNVLTWLAMTELGARAARGERPGPATMGRLEAIAAKEPLAPEPFLVKAALAQMDGRPDLAERLFVAARRREPRSEAARFFLANHYLRTGRTIDALTEMAVMSRLIPNASAQFAPALAAFAADRSVHPQLRHFFRHAPEYEPLVLDQLARSPANTDLVLSLWSGRKAGAQTVAQPDWKSRLVTGLVERGEYARAYGVWRRLSGVESSPDLIFNPDFRKLDAPAPFNWTFQSGAGVADPVSSGGLDVIYFGRADAVLAEQLLVLAPGNYRLSMAVRGGTPEQSSVSWTLACLPSGSRLVEVPIGQEQSARRIERSFSVPQGCGAQRLQLAGTAGEFARSAEFTITDLHLIRVSGR